MGQEAGTSKRTGSRIASKVHETFERLFLLNPLTRRVHLLGEWDERWMLSSRNPTVCFFGVGGRGEGRLVDFGR